jgi:hypothetical protein
MKFRFLPFLVLPHVLITGAMDPGKVRNKVDNAEDEVGEDLISEDDSEPRRSDAGTKSKVVPIGGKSNEENESVDKSRIAGSSDGHFSGSISRGSSTSSDSNVGDSRQNDILVDDDSSIDPQEEDQSEETQRDRLESDGGNINNDVSRLHIGGKKQEDRDDVNAAQVGKHIPVPKADEEDDDLSGDEKRRLDESRLHASIQPPVPAVRSANNGVVDDNEDVPRRSADDLRELLVEQSSNKDEDDLSSSQIEGDDLSGNPHNILDGEISLPGDEDGNKDLVAVQNAPPAAVIPDTASAIVNKQIPAPSAPMAENSVEIVAENGAISELSELLSQLYGKAVTDFAHDASTYEGHTLEIDCNHKSEDYDWKVNVITVLCPFLRDDDESCGSLRHSSYMVTEPEKLCSDECAKNMDALWLALPMRKRLVKRGGKKEEAAIFRAVVNSILLQYASACRVGTWFVPD